MKSRLVVSQAHLNSYTMLSLGIQLKAVGFFSGVCHVKLERRRREDRGVVGAEGSGVWGPPPQKFFAFFISKW